MPFHLDVSSLLRWPSKYRRNKGVDKMQHRFRYYYRRDVGWHFFFCLVYKKEEVESIVKPMSEVKKSMLEECMRKIMEADGPANETEIGVWWIIQMAHNLPTWVSRSSR